MSVVMREHIAAEFRAARDAQAQAPVRKIIPYSGLGYVRKAATTAVKGVKRVIGY